MTSAMRALVARVNRGEPAGVRPPAGGPQAAGESSELASWPATPVQRQAWVLDKMLGCGPSYSVPFVFEVSGPAESGALARAVASTAAANAVFNTRFEMAGAMLWQARREEPLFAASGPAIEDVAEPGARDIVRESARRAFDIARGPLLRVRLLRLSPTCHWVVWVTHHSAMDGWSVRVLMRQLAESYATGRPPDAGPLRWPSHAVADAQRRCSETAAAELAAWRARLDGCDPSRATVPLDYRRPARPSFAADSVRFAFTGLRPGPHDLAAAMGLSLFTVLFTSFQLTVAALSGHDDVVTGVPLLNRVRLGEHQLVGPLSNTVPVRVKVPPASAGGTTTASMPGGRPPPTALHAALTATESAVIDALSGQGVAVPDLVRQMPALRAEPGISPLFRQLFNMGNLPGGADGVELAPGVLLRPVPVPNGTVRLDLEFTLEDTADTIAGRLEYNAALYAPPTAARVVEEYETRLAWLCSLA
jgi:hypothetical protein